MKGPLLVCCFLLVVFVGISYSQTLNQGRDVDSIQLSVVQSSMADLAESAQSGTSQSIRFRWQKLGLDYYFKKYGTIAVSDIERARFDDLQAPGYYFESSKGRPVDADSNDISFLENLLSKYLSPEYYNRAILDSVKSVYLDSLQRREFYFETTSNNVHFRFSGWYGKFAHIFVFTDFDSKAGFIDKANKYFNLPKLKESKVSFDKSKFNQDISDFFYSYNDSNIAFYLCGYPDIRCRLDNDSGNEMKIKCWIDNVVLDLTVYSEEK